MPLLDHFRPPLDDEAFWESFHSAWAVAIMRRLNRHLLPRERYRAQAQFQLGRSIEIDVATLEHARPEPPRSNGVGGVALATWAPSAAAWHFPATFPDDIEILI